jgi:hypothetical protein
LTKSVKDGPPNKACLAPFIDDLVSPLGNIGSAMVASAVFFILMLFVICPVCCFKRKEDEPQGTMEGKTINEGGDAIEMGAKKHPQNADLNDDEQQNVTGVHEKTQNNMMGKDVDI